MANTLHQLTLVDLIHEVYLCEASVCHFPLSAVTPIRQLVIGREIFGLGARTY